MAELPHFTGGQFGKLQSEHLNDLVEVVRANSDALRVSQLAQTLQPRGGSGNFPIIAKLLKPYEGEGEDEGEGKGEGYADQRNASTESNSYGEGGGGQDTIGLITYEWEEWGIFATGSEFRALESERRRKYVKGKRNVAIPAYDNSSGDMPATTSDFSGAIVFLHPYNDNRGVARLVFQMPMVSTQLSMVKTSYPNCSEISAGHSYELVAIRRTKSGWQPHGASFTAYNGTEIFNNGDMGGQVSGNPSCNIRAYPTAVPAGTIVLTTSIPYDGQIHTVFTVANDVCVECLCSATAEESYPQPSVTSDNPFVNFVPGSDTNTQPMLGGSIVMEMLK